MVDSTELQLSVPSLKLKKIRSEARGLADLQQTTARKLSQLLGSSPLAQLFYRGLQCESGNLYDDTTFTISEAPEEGP